MKWFSAKEGVAKKRRQAELEHEKELAKIRTQSKALIWTVTAEQLTTIITSWYEAGLLQAESVQDALEKAAPHFVTPGGARIITTQTPPTSLTASTVRRDVALFSASYQAVTFRGQTYDLTAHKYAPRILKVLHESLIKGDPGLTTSRIRKLANLPHNGKMYDWFRGTGLWKTLVVGAGRDMYRLDCPV